MLLEPSVIARAEESMENSLPFHLSDARSEASPAVHPWEGLTGLERGEV